MKSLHRPDLFGWSAFDEARNVDFHGTLWARAEGNVVFDPMPLSAHDTKHVESLGGVAWILLTNADHVRAARETAQRFGARIAAPLAEREFAELGALDVAEWLEPDRVATPGVQCIAMRGSKTPGELAFLLPPGDTVVCGDLVRGQRAGSLNLLPDAKLTDKAAAIASVRALASLPELCAVLVGDGCPVFRDGRARLEELVAASASA